MIQRIQEIKHLKGFSKYKFMLWYFYCVQNFDLNMSEVLPWRKQISKFKGRTLSASCTLKNQDKEHLEFQKATQTPNIESVSLREDKKYQIKNISKYVWLCIVRDKKMFLHKGLKGQTIIFSLRQASLICLFQHFGLLRLCINIHDPQRMRPNDFCNPLTFHVMPPWTVPIMFVLGEKTFCHRWSQILASTC